MNAGQITQIGAEVWVTGVAGVRGTVTQMGLEVWAPLPGPYYKSFLFRTDVTPNADTTYVENGLPMQFNYQTTLLPDNERMSQNMITRTDLSMASVAGLPVVSVQAADTNNQPISSYGLALAGAPTLWDAAIWDAAPWDGTQSNISPYRIAWPKQLVFKQMSIQAIGACAAGFKIGNLYLDYQVLGYTQETNSGVR